MTTTRTKPTVELPAAVLDIIDSQVKGAAASVTAGTVSEVVVAVLDDDETTAAVQVAALAALKKLLDPPPAQELMYPTVLDWCEEWLAVIYRRQVHEIGSDMQRRWCPQWYFHGEAIDRLTALWQAWEHLRLQPGLGQATFWLSYADPMMTRLLDPEGPFKYCSVTEGHGEGRLANLPTAPMSERMQQAMFPGSVRRDPNRVHGLITTSRIVVPAHNRRRVVATRP